LPAAWQPYCLHVSFLLGPALYCSRPGLLFRCLEGFATILLLFNYRLISGSFLHESVRTLARLLSPLRVSNCACCGTQGNRCRWQGRGVTRLRLSHAQLCLRHNSAPAIYDRPRFVCVFRSATCCSLHRFVAYCTRVASAARPRRRMHVYMTAAIMCSSTSA